MTFEEVHYDLAYYGEDRNLHRQIIVTIMRLPDEFQPFALGRCRFLSVGESVYGMTLPGKIGSSGWPGHRTRNMWITLLTNPLPEESSQHRCP